jgi:hypothetical protein
LPEKSSNEDVAAQQTTGYFSVRRILSDSSGNAFPPPGGGQTEWPVFVYSQHQVLTKLQPNGQPVVQYGWQSADLEDRVRLPIILICVLTAGGFVLSASPRVTDYPSDPSYRAIFRDPRAPRSRRR